MKTKKKRPSWLQLISVTVLMILSINPGSTALASNTTVTASGVIVPAKVSQLGFLLSGIAGEVPVKEGDTVTAGQTLMVLDTPDLQFAVSEAQAALHSVQAYADLQKYQKVKNQRNGKIFYDTVPEEYRQRADAKVQQAQVALELAQINLAEGTLTAPFEGVVASIKVIPGEFVPSDEAVITLASLNNLQLETTDLSERDVTNVRIGAPVEISVEALDQTVKGKVVSVSPIADTVSGDVVFKVTIAFDPAGQPKGLLWGMTAVVRIE